MPKYSIYITGDIKNATMEYVVIADSIEQALERFKTGNEDYTELLNGDFEADDGHWEGLELTDIEETPE